jgi:hypothetical protein
VVHALSTGAPWLLHKDWCSRTGAVVYRCLL